MHATSVVQGDAASDLAAGYLGACPVGSKRAESVMMALSNFMGHDKLRELYTNRAMVFVPAIRGFPAGPFPHQASILPRRQKASRNRWLSR